MFRIHVTVRSTQSNLSVSSSFLDFNPSRLIDRNSRFNVHLAPPVVLSILPKFLNGVYIKRGSRYTRALANLKRNIRNFRHHKDILLLQITCLEDV